MKTAERAPSMAAYLDDLEARGRLLVRLEDLRAEYPEMSQGALNAALWRLAQKSRVVRLRRGLLAIIPVEYRSWGAPPPDWFVDGLMKYLGQPYYVGVLSAARLHGATHQTPQVFQVVTTKAQPAIEIQRIRVEFLVNKHLEAMPTCQKQVYSGSLTVSTPETTALDLVRYVDHAAGLSNVATVLQELGEAMDAARLCELARAERCPYSPRVVCRLGHLLDVAKQRTLADSLWGRLFGGRPQKGSRRRGRAKGEQEEPLSETLQRAPEGVFWKQRRGERVPDYNRIFGWYLRELTGRKGPEATVPIRFFESEEMANLTSFQRNVAREAKHRKERPVEVETPRVPLRPDLPVDPELIPDRWGVLANVEVEPDL